MINLVLGLGCKEVKYILILGNQKFSRSVEIILISPILKDLTLTGTVLDIVTSILPKP